MNDLVDALAFIAAVLAPFVVLIIFSAIGIAVAYLIFLLLTYQFERVRLSEARQNKRLLRDIRSGRV